MKNTKRILLAAVAALLLVAVSVGGTLAWLTASTQTITNTFSPSDINITLAETTGTEYKMVPGATIEKNPKVTVVAGSEDCWLFVKVEKSGNFDAFMTYTMADGWTPLTGVDGVYYRQVAASSADQDFNVLNNNEVTVLNTVTKGDMTGLTEATYPTLKFTAYAIQQEGFATAAAAWAEVSK